MKSHQEIIAAEMDISIGQIERTLLLLNGGATVPFIARYRKEMTGSLDEVTITKIRDRNIQLNELDKRKESIINTIREQGKLTEELEKQIYSITTMVELEDVYLPYRPKRKTRATIAIAKGLEPLARKIMEQSMVNIELIAETYINIEKDVNNIEQAIAGARDIIAEWINESQTARIEIRKLFLIEAKIKSKVIKGKEKEGAKYENYFDCEELLKKSPSHRILAMFRGENDGFLKLTIAPIEEKSIAILEKIFIKRNNVASIEVQKAIKDSYKRLLSPSIETEIRQFYKLKADEEAIKVFVENVRQLLLSPPLGEKNVLAIDPGYRTGCKIVCLDKNGKLLHNETIYPHPPESQVKQSANKINNLINAYKIEAIAIGNGTAGRETERFIKSIRFEKDIIALMVNESGASVYSASAVAREEFPEYDITVRGAVSIGRRLMDPLAELVKIDPKSIGVGQYQHDVDQKLLQHSLDDAVMSCVNAVGVEVNTASKQLLTYVSGVGSTLAENLIDYRNKNGAFKSREDFKKVPRFGDKAFEQAAGFLRIRDSINLLDRSAVHPESYKIVETISKDLNCNIEELIGNKELRKNININKYITSTIGLPTLQDILNELEKPGRDPRVKFDFFEFDKNVHSMKDLEIGMVLPGIVTNITAFGAFVDIGVHQDGLVHISQMADKFISNPSDVVKLNQKVRVRVVEVDIERKRIQLSMKDIK